MNKNILSIFSKYNSKPLELVSMVTTSLLLSSCGLMPDLGNYDNNTAYDANGAKSFQNTWDVTLPSGGSNPEGPGKTTDEATGDKVVDNATPVTAVTSVTTANFDQVRHSKCKENNAYVLDLNGEIGVDFEYVKKGLTNYLINEEGLPKDLVDGWTDGDFEGAISDALGMIPEGEDATAAGFEPEPLEIDDLLGYQAKQSFKLSLCTDDASTGSDSIPVYGYITDSNFNETASTVVYEIGNGSNLSKTNGKITLNLKFARDINRDNLPSIVNELYSKKTSTRPGSPVVTQDNYKKSIELILSSSGTELSLEQAFTGSFVFKPYTSAGTTPIDEVNKVIPGAIRGQLSGKVEKLLDKSIPLNGTSAPSSPVNPTNSPNVDGSAGDPNANNGGGSPSGAGTTSTGNTSIGGGNRVPGNPTGAGKKAKKPSSPIATAPANSNANELLQSSIGVDLKIDAMACPVDHEEKRIKFEDPVFKMNPVILETNYLRLELEKLSSRDGAGKAESTLISRLDDLKVSSEDFYVQVCVDENGEIAKDGSGNVLPARAYHVVENDGKQYRSSVIELTPTTFSSAGLNTHSKDFFAIGADGKFIKKDPTKSRSPKVKRYNYAFIGNIDLDIAWANVFMPKDLRFEVLSLDRVALVKPDLDSDQIAKYSPTWEPTFDATKGMQERIIFGFKGFKDDEVNESMVSLQARQYSADEVEGFKQAFRDDAIKPDEIQELDLLAMVPYPDYLFEHPKLGTALPIISHMTHPEQKGLISFEMIEPAAAAPVQPKKTTGSVNLGNFNSASVEKLTEFEPDVSTPFNTILPLDDAGLSTLAEDQLGSQVSRNVLLSECQNYPIKTVLTMPVSLALSPQQSEPNALQDIKDKIAGKFDGGKFIASKLMKTNVNDLIKDFQDSIQDLSENSRQTDWGLVLCYGEQKGKASYISALFVDAKPNANQLKSSSFQDYMNRFDNKKSFWLQSHPHSFVYMAENNDGEKGLAFRSNFYGLHDWAQVGGLLGLKKESYTAMARPGLITIVKLNIEMTGFLPLSGLSSKDKLTGNSLEFVPDLQMFETRAHRVKKGKAMTSKESKIIRPVTMAGTQFSIDETDPEKRAGGSLTLADEFVSFDLAAKYGEISSGIFEFNEKAKLK